MLKLVHSKFYVHIRELCMCFETLLSAHIEFWWNSQTGENSLCRGNTNHRATKCCESNVFQLHIASYFIQGWTQTDDCKNAIHVIEKRIQEQLWIIKWAKPLNDRKVIDVTRDTKTVFPYLNLLHVCENCFSVCLSHFHSVILLILVYEFQTEMKKIR